MSRYALEEALNDFIDNRVNDSFASYDHDHDITAFEDKVTEYLGENFTAGAGCNVQQAFESSVRKIIVQYLDNDSHSDGLVRIVLQQILNRARSLPTDDVLPILLECSGALNRIDPSTEPSPTTASPTDSPVPALS